MNEVWIIFLALLAGVLLGTIFFGAYGGRWRRASPRTTAALFAGSMLLRTAVAVAGFYYFSRATGIGWRVASLALFSRG